MQEKSPVFEILCPIMSKLKIVETIKSLEKMQNNVLSAIEKKYLKNI